MLEACAANDSAAIHQLIHKGASLEMALFCAAREHNLPIVQELLKAGANPNCMFDGETTPLYAAIGNKSLGECDGWCGGSFHVSAYKGQNELVKALLDAGANPNMPSSYRKLTPLSEAARSDDSDTVNLLLAAGAEINAQDIVGMTALHWAALEHRNNIVSQLLNAGAQTHLLTCASEEASIVSRYGSGHGEDKLSPLHIAAHSGNTKGVELLLAAGVAPDTPDAAGNTPFLHAASAESQPLLRLLTDEGVDIHHTNNIGENALDQINFFNNADSLDALRYLLQAGVRPAMRCLFTRAALRQNIEVIRTLGEAGLRCHPADEYGNSALNELFIWARPKDEARIIEAIDLLMQYGGDMPTMGYRALKAASQAGMKRVYDHLLKSGAPATPPPDSDL
ncbi:MAG: ankyrin repeat domain-containing protein [Akkermansia sp.]|nr:ankyrin repeat domain-containing protein [Akkermansia sp.]